MNAPLAGMRVLDLTRVLAGPSCTMTLADLGADVWKIERPHEGDETRAWRPPEKDGEAAYYLSVNRSKRSVCVDFATEGGARIIRELAARADVLVENYRTGALARYGLDAQTLCAAHPRLVYCSISGYGRDSALADRAGYDFVIQAESGLMAITGPVDGEPMKVGVAIVDVLAGGLAVQGILAALVARERDGVGGLVDVALHDAALAALVNVGSGSLVSGKDARRFGNGHPNIVPYQPFPVADGDIAIACGNDRQFRWLCEELGLTALADDPRFATNPGRVVNREELFALLLPEFARRRRDELIEALERRGVPCGAVRTVAEALHSDAARERAMVVELRRADGTSYETIASPLRLERTPITEPRPAPRLGEHTDDVLREVLGYDEATIGALRADGAIA